MDIEYDGSALLQSALLPNNLGTEARANHDRTDIASHAI
jgi:hypothetical protein